MTKKTFTIIRHGESQSNAGEKTDHPTTVALTAKGRQQAEDAATRYAGNPDIVITSRYIRTKQTAEPFLKKIGNVRQEEWDIHEYTYLSVTRYRGTTNTERRPSMTAYWEKADPHYKEDETAESFAEFVARCKKLVKMMGEFEGDTALAFCHGYVMNGVLLCLQGRLEKADAETMRVFWQFHAVNDIGNCTRLDFDVDDNGKVTLKKPPALQRKPKGPGFND